MPRWLKITFKIIGAIIALLLLLLFGVMLYITFNKAKVLKRVNTELNKNLDGTIVIGDMRPQFFKGFPYVSLALKNVVIRDRRFPQHHHTLLDAKDFDVSVNTFALFNGTISINHIGISNATIDLYTDSTGYSNTSVFKKGPKKPKDTTQNSTSAELGKFSLSNVDFRVENDKAKKLFDFIVNDIKGKIAYPDSGFHAYFHLDVTAKSMSFKTKNGSFIKDKTVQGDLEAGYNERKGSIAVTSKALAIGDDPFKVNAVFESAKGLAGFNIHLCSNELLWRHASSLVSGNIQQKLNQFDIDKPIAVTALIKGSFTGGEPLLYITAKVHNSKVSIPGANIDACSFDGVFTNNYENGKELGDENSVIRLIGLKGSYKHLPFTVDTGSIVNLIKPYAMGNFRADFPASDLNYLLGNKVVRFTNGTADMKLRFKADVVNFQLNKPFIAGNINLKNADIHYIPTNLLMKNSSVSLNFVGDNLVMNNIRLQTGRSIVTMEGRVNNFLNLYYSDPEKIVLTLQIHSTQLHLGEFIGFLNEGDRSGNPAATRTSNSGNIIAQLSNVLEKGSAAIHLDADNVHYFKFLATDVHADLLTIEHGLIIKNVSVKNAGGFLRLNGSIKRENNINLLELKTTISNVNVHEFFYSFDNFGLTAFTYENLEGFLSARTSITAGITYKGSLALNSVNGNLDVNLKQGKLINFKPIVSVAKFAFPFRNVRNISIAELDAHFDIQGDQIIIHPMKISSNVLNMDVAGIYGIKGYGTNIALDVPTRNPKNDTTIHDQEKLANKRYKGVVLHILAKADATGKIKIGWNKGRKKGD